MEVESVIRKYIPSRTGKRYEIYKQGLGVVIKKLDKEETKVIPEVFSKPIPQRNVIKPTYMKPIEARKMLDEMAKSKVESNKAKEQKPTITKISNHADMPSFSNFNDIKKFVEQKQKENSEKNKKIIQELKKETVTPDEQEDIDDLVNGNIQKEQKLINESYLKTLEARTLKHLFKMVTGFNPNNKMNNYELRKVILSKYEEMPSSKKQLVYEASKLKY